MINLGARFDDRITGRTDAFCPGSKKVHVDIDASSINKIIRVDLPIVGDVGHVLEDVLKVWKARGRKTRSRRGPQMVGPDRRLAAQGIVFPTRTRKRPSSRNTRCNGWRR